MDENFILNAFRKMGLDPLSVKMIRDRNTGGPAGYCFVNFRTRQEAYNAVSHLDGKPMPETDPAFNFRLKWALGPRDERKGHSVQAFKGLVMYGRPIRFPNKQF